MFEISSNFEDAKMADHILKSFLSKQSFYDTLLSFVKYQNDFQVVSEFPCLSGAGFHV